MGIGEGDNGGVVLEMTRGLEVDGSEPSPAVGRQERRGDEEKWEILAEDAGPRAVLVGTEGAAAGAGTGGSSVGDVEVAAASREGEVQGAGEADKEGERDAEEVGSGVGTVGIIAATGAAAEKGCKELMLVAVIPGPSSETGMVVVDGMKKIGAEVADMACWC